MVDFTKTVAVSATSANAVCCRPPLLADTQLSLSPTFSAELLEQVVLLAEVRSEKQSHPLILLILIQLTHVQISLSATFSAELPEQVGDALSDGKLEEQLENKIMSEHQ